MKNIFLTLLVSVIMLGIATAQDLTNEPGIIKSKRGFTVLPEAGEWGLGVSANPFLRYLGNIMNSDNNSEPTFDYPSNPANNIAIFGKYVVDENTQYRVRFNISASSASNRGMLLQDEITPDPLFPNYTQDLQNVTSQSIVLAAGYEKRRGTTRLQGAYGGELVVGYSGSKQTYEYGNPLQVDFTQPNTYNFGDNIFQDGDGDYVSRKTEQKLAPSLLVGARGFIGVEYFFAPKMAIGGEFGYTLAFRNTGKTEFTTEQWNFDTNAVVKAENNIADEQGGFTSVGFGLDNLSGSINLLFYF
jgi:hypothetical protein